MELFGFKSFAEKTEVFFDQGVTCIVGPNGCGKSNISDAIRWVLGERSAKLLRGSKMEDVIFNGTDYRKPLGMAEVSLTIDNSDRGLPIDYQEVTITRRLYRSGESEYLINKTPCRLKDIQDLILDTGIGSNSYSMIEQGRIDYILNADPEKRRFLIEEAAGISKYKVKKEEAIRKLERTQFNLERLTDIVLEVQRNIQYAERQAKRAQKYKDKYERLKNLEVCKAFYDLSQIGTQKSAMAHSRYTEEEKIKTLECQIADFRQQQDQLKETLYGILDKHTAQENKRLSAHSKIEQNEQRMRFHQETRLEMSARRGQIEQERKQLLERIEKSVGEIACKKRDLTALNHQKSEAYGTLEDSQNRFQEIEQKLKAIKREIEDIKDKSFLVASETTRIRNEYHRLEAFLETSTEHRKKQEAGSLRLQQEVQESHEKRRRWTEEIEGFQNQMEECDQKHRVVLERLETLKNQSESMKRETQTIARQINEKEARLQMLRELEDTSTNQAETILENFDGVQKELTKSLQEVFEVKPGYEWALDAALHAYAKSLVVENIDTANKLLKRMREIKSAPLGLFIKQSAGDESFSEEFEKPLHPSIRQALKEVVEIHPEYQVLFEPFIRNVYIVDNASDQVLNELLPLAGDYKFITHEGVIISSKGSVFYQNGKLSENCGFFRRKAESESIQQDIHQLKQWMDARQTDTHGWDQEIDALEVEREAILGKKTEFAIQKESLESLAREIDKRLEASKREIDLIRLESEEVQSQREEAKALVRQRSMELAEAERKEHEIRDRQQHLSRDIEANDQVRTDAMQIFAEKKARFDQLEERINILTESLLYQEERDKEDHAQIDALSEEWNQIEEKERRLIEEDNRIKAEQSMLDQTRREAEISLEFIRQERQEAESALSHSHEEMQSFIKREQDLKDKIHKLDMQNMDFGFQEKTITERLIQTYKINLSELRADDYPIDSDLASIHQQIEQLQSQVESLGTVNLLAIEEYDDLKQRYDFLSGQQKDLEEAKTSLMETIRKINRTTKGLFEQTFQELQQTFQDYFENLFRGGQARLVLLDEENPLESGVDIVVRPPGKKLQHITLLSGGEKALTAIALLFALFKIKPSPFSVLDEVDAPLDEANIDRFLHVLRSFLKLSQFILVTHNRKTIAMGDALYGVTMEEAGVSKIVSVKVSHDDSVLEEKIRNKAEREPSKEEVHI